eukprot:4851406-Pleurochrysis_carterae.AAC.1
MARKPSAAKPSEPVGRWAPIASSSGASPTLFGEGRRVSPDHGRSPAEALVVINQIIAGAETHFDYGA